MAVRGTSVNALMELILACLWFLLLLHAYAQNTVNMTEAQYDRVVAVKWTQGSEVAFVNDSRGSVTCYLAGNNESVMDTANNAHGQWHGRLRNRGDRYTLFPLMFEDAGHLWCHANGTTVRYAWHITVAAKDDAPIQYTKSPFVRAWDLYANGAMPQSARMVTAFVIIAVLITGSCATLIVMRCSARS